VTSRAISKPRAAKALPKRKHHRISSPAPTHGVKRAKRGISPSGYQNSAQKAFHMRRTAGNDPSLPIIPEEQVRSAINVYWHGQFRPRSPHFICPDGTALIPKVMRSYSVNSHQMVKSVLYASEKAYLDGGGGYDACRNAAGHPALKIDLQSGEMLMISKMLNRGLGTALVCELVNSKRKAKNEPTVSSNTLKSAAKEAGGSVDRRKTQSAGSSDSTAAWTKGRLAQAEMVLRMLGTAGLGPLQPGEFSIKADSVLHFDQKHKQCELGGGCGAKWAWLFSRDDAGMPVKTEPNAAPGEKDDKDKKVTSTKYCKEARFCFAACAPTVLKDGKPKRVGRRCSQPFIYSKQWLLGVKAFKAEVAAEIVRVDANKKMPNKKNKETGEGTGYKHFFPDTWYEEAEKETLKHHVCCSMMVDWVVEQGTEMFKGTTAESSWAINGDGLSQWWDATTQEYMKETYPNEFKRQIRNADTDKVPKRYRGSLVGNSPEWMPLDSNLFADLERLIIIHRALTYMYSIADPRRFSIGTPKQCESAVSRAWQMVPEGRIIRDCDRWAEAYQVVYDNKGKVVRGWGRRSGRRAQRDREQPEMATQFHADAQDGVNSLLELA